MNWQGTTAEQRDTARSLLHSFLEGEDSFKNKVFDTYHFPYEFIYGDIPCEQMLFDLLKRSYHNDYLIRHRFAKSVLSHTSAISFFEYPLLDSRIDVVSVNGKSVAYEIKTSFDSFYRLKKQISDYSRCFEYVYVICPKDRFDELLKILPDHCGVYVYDDHRINASFHKKIEATFSPFLSPRCMLGAMTKKERQKRFHASDEGTILSKYDEKHICNVFKAYLRDKYKNEWEIIKDRCSHA